MSHGIYTTQSKLRIQITTGIDLSAATATAIKYKSPTGTTGQWVATISDAANGVIYYDLTSAELSTKGKWLFWAYVTFAGPLYAPGDPVAVIVSEEPS